MSSVSAVGPGAQLAPILNPLMQGTARPLAAQAGIVQQVDYLAFKGAPDRTIAEAVQAARTLTPACPINAQALKALQTSSKDFEVVGCGDSWAIWPANTRGKLVHLDEEWRRTHCPDRTYCAVPIKGNGANGVHAHDKAARNVAYMKPPRRTGDPRPPFWPNPPRRNYYTRKPHPGGGVSGYCGNAIVFFRRDPLYKPPLILCEPPPGPQAFAETAACADLVAEHSVRVVNQCINRAAGYTRSPKLKPPDPPPFAFCNQGTDAIRCGKEVLNLPQAGILRNPALVKQYTDQCCAATVRGGVIYQLTWAGTRTYMACSGASMSCGTKTYYAPPGENITPAFAMQWTLDNCYGERPLTKEQWKARIAAKTAGPRVFRKPGVRYRAPLPPIDQPVGHTSPPPSTSAAPPVGGGVEECTCRTINCFRRPGVSQADFEAACCQFGLYCNGLSSFWYCP